MKEIFIALWAFVACLNSYAQSYSSKDELKTVIQQRTIYLNSGSRSSVGGKSRVTIPMALPQGTKRWYYTFSTSPGGSGTANLNLLAQLSIMAVAPAGITQSALSGLEIPPGSGSIDVYVLDRANEQAFLDKIDNDGGTVNYYSDVSVSNTKDAVVPVDIVASGLYLGLKNPSMWEGINVTIEVVALVASDLYDDKWTAENIDILYTNCMDNFVLTGDERDRICDCYKSKITKGYRPSAFTELAESEMNLIHAKTIKECSKTVGGDGFISKDKKAQETLELYQGQAITKDYLGMEQSLQTLISLGMRDDQIYNGLGFCQLCLKKMDDAKKNLTIGLGKNPEDLLLLGNLANYYLLTNQYDLAIEIFNEHKNKKLADDRKFKQAVADDLKEFERIGIRHQDFNRVRSELNIH